MEFECRTVPILKPVLNTKGVMAPLCNSCTQIECTNPIKKKKVSILGKTEEWNVFVVGSQAYQVVQCLGYSE